MILWTPSTGRSGTMKETTRTSNVLAIQMPQVNDQKINDPLGQTYISADNHYSHLKIVLFRLILKSGDVRTDNVCKNSDHNRLCVNGTSGSTSLHWNIS